MPLDIETVVEKYASLGSEAIFVADLRRHGTGRAAIEKALNQRRALRGDDTDRVSQIERFRSKLNDEDRVGLIGSYVALFGSHERVIPLWEATQGEPPEVFWLVWLEWWNMCEASKAGCRAAFCWTLSAQDPEIAPLLNSIVRKRNYFWNRCRIL